MSEKQSRSKKSAPKRKRRLNKGRVFLCLFGLLLVAALIAGTAALLSLKNSPGQKSSSNSSSSPAASGTVSATDPGGAGDGGVWSLSEGKAYYHGADGAVFTGEQVIDGETCRFAQDGSLTDGWATIGTVRYHFSGGILSRGTQVIDGITRYINEDGTMNVGWYEGKTTGNTYYYDYQTGGCYRGWHEIDGKRYYFYESGALARSTTVDGVVMGSDGAAAGQASGTTTALTTTAASGSGTAATRTPVKPDGTVSAEMGKRLDDILSKYGRTPLEIYNYVHDHFTYKWTAEQSLEENAAHMLDYGTGSCYNFAALTYLLFQRAGYDVYYVTGKGWQPGDYHCWILANFDGGWYYVDSLYVRSAKLTAAELTAKGYEWDKSELPS